MNYSLPLFIASDHAGFALKQFLQKQTPQWDWKDLGPSDKERTDYPLWAQKLCNQITNQHIGVLICGSGQGVCMTANRHSHIRASLCWSKEVASITRLHNNSNVLCLGSRFISQETALEVLNAFMTTSFSEDQVHKRRIEAISK